MKTDSTPEQPPEALREPSDDSAKREPLQLPKGALIAFRKRGGSPIARAKSSSIPMGASVSADPMWRKKRTSMCRAR